MYRYENFTIQGGISVIASLMPRIKSYNIDVEIDRNLISPNGRIVYPIDWISNSTITIQINQYKLIHAIGSIQSRRFNPSNRQKFTDKKDLIEKIKNEPDFKVKIDEIRSLLGSETLGKISEDFGVGIAVLVADYLYQIDQTTIHRITSHGKRPDLKCLTRNGEVLVVESKGYSNYNNLMGQLRNAQTQKNSVISDIHAVSLTLIKENDITTNYFMDPPNIPSDRDKELEKRIQRAKHYASIFSFIGQSELSKYFSYMKNRLEETEDIHVLEKKERLYSKIKNNYIEIDLLGIKFKGTLEKTDENMLIFLGIDERLLSLDGFISFEEYPSDSEHFTNESDFFYIYRDGICVGELITDIPNSKFKHYQKNTRILDIDDMNLMSFKNYIEYLFELNDFEVINENFMNNESIIHVRKNNRTYQIEINHNYSSISSENKILVNNFRENTKRIIITNGYINKDIKEDDFNIVIDREILKKLTRNNIFLKNFIELKD